MRVEACNTPDTLRAFLGGRVQVSFQQSWEWGEVMEARGGAVKRFVVMDDDDHIVAAATIVRQSLPIGKAILYCPRGPVVDERMRGDDLPLLRAMLVEAIHDDSFARGAILFRFEPLVSEITAGYCTLPVQPKRTLVLDGTSSEDELLGAMHQKTRYNIRLAEKKGVTVVRRTDVEAVDIFWTLLQQTTQRDSFRPHPKSSYDTIIDTLGQSDWQDRTAASAAVDVALYNDTPIAANIVVGFGDMVTYLHGASSDKDRNVMAPYLLQWHAIREARADGYERYDFHGIAETDDPCHTWAGITRFKKGFGGRVVEFPGTFDVPFSAFWYALYRVARKAIRSV